MNDKSRFEEFLDDYSWLLKPLIAITLILWAMQGNFIVKEMYDQIKNQPPRNIEIEIKMQKEVSGLIEELVEKAKANKNYGPKDYFDDYKRIEIKKYEFNYPYDPPFYLIRLGELQCISMQNVGKDRLYDDNDISNAARSFSEWKKSGGPAGDEFHQMLDEKREREGLFKAIIEPILTWSWVAYFRGLFLVIALFFVRMANRKGIAETILADKKRFFVSVILWPLFIMKYPFNVVKEIIVEAEVRRIGNIFRRLTEKEREFVVQVASANNFRRWLLEFRAENSMIFQRSFVTALISIIIIYLFLPVFSEAMVFESNRDGPVISMAISGDLVILSDCDSQSELQLIYHDVIFSESYFEMSLRTSVILKMFERKIKIKNIFRKIEHVPVFGRSFVYSDTF